MCARDRGPRRKVRELTAGYSNDALSRRGVSLLLQTFRRETEAHPAGGTCHCNARIRSDDV